MPILGGRDITKTDAIGVSGDNKTARLNIELGSQIDGSPIADWLCAIHLKTPAGAPHEQELAIVSMPPRAHVTFVLEQGLIQSGTYNYTLHFLHKTDGRIFETRPASFCIAEGIDASGAVIKAAQPGVIDQLLVQGADHESRINTLETTGGGGTGGTTDHSKLVNRDLAKQHPMSAIDGLQAALDAKQSAGAYLTSETDPTVPAWAKQPAKPSYTPQETGADASGTAASKVEEHNASATSHGDIRTALGLKADLVNGLIPSAQLPGYVDDVLEFDTLSALPAVGVSGRIYVTLDTNLTYRWGGTSYVEISASLALGETAATAYPGNKGKVAYDHSQSPHAPVDAEKNVQGDWSVVDEGSDAFIKNKPTSMAPNAHKASHATGGNDALSTSDIGAEASGAVAAHNTANDAHSDIRTALAAKKNISDGMTATAYAAIATKDPNTLYLIVGE